MKKKIASILAIVLSATMLSACGGTQASSNATNEKLPVSVTFDAMAEFVQAVGKDKVSVSTIIPDGTEPHDFEPKVKDLEKLSTTKVFVYNGMDMETWVPKAIQSANNKSLVAVEASSGVEPLKSTEKSESQQYDPHVWISLKGAQTEVKNIANGLMRADAKNKDYYAANAQAFETQLQQLYDTYAAKFQTAPRKDFVTGHAAFGYLCRDFGLQQNSVEDVFASGEPSAAKLAGLVNYCKANNVKTIFVEDMVSPAVSKTLAKEVGAQAKTIYTMESREDKKDYLTRMTDNLDEIYASLTQS